jgi:uncharacterized protein with HEPN domain
LKDIVENIARIRRYTDGYTRERFVSDQQCQDAVERCLSRISEAARKLGGLPQEVAPHQPWSDIRAIGNILRHEYDLVIVDAIWRVVTEDLPRLEADLKEALSKLPDPSPNH